jgi:hypothetical protein
MEVMVCLVPSDKVEALWPKAETFLKRSYEKNDQLVPGDLLQQLIDGYRCLWVLIETQPEMLVIGAGVTAIFQMKNGKALKIEHLGGDHMEAWSDKRSVIEAYAKAEGCDRVLCEGRPGWTRVLTDYETVAVVLEKRL